jgi:hypothetical protein
MNAFQRIMALRPSPRVFSWSRIDFMRSATEAVKRWRQLEQTLGIQFGFLYDALAVIAPDFTLDPLEEEAICACPIPRRRNVSARLAFWFVKWDRCPQTRAHPNPYEPLIAIWEHGGAFGMEHGMFLEIEDTTGLPCGGLVVCREETP